MKSTSNRIIIVLSAFLCLCLASVYGAQDDTVKIVKVTDVPVIDGVGDDACWATTTWQSIDEVWIPYGGSVTSSDYQGRYKVVWSQEENLMYFLTEITDDIVVGGYSTLPSAGVYNYDILEVFLDENKSGGYHMTDDGAQNAENAFAYHMFAEFPSGNETITDLIVEDSADPTWTNHDFADHFPEFAMKKNGTLCIREFSLKVYDDTYIGTSPEDSRVQLAEGKVMGMSLAYCDNDDINEDPKERDNFFGSVWVEESAFNNHWMNADDFGAVKISGPGSIVATKNIHIKNNDFNVYVDPGNRVITVDTSNDYYGRMNINVYNITGKCIYSTNAEKQNEKYFSSFHIENLRTGLYMLELQAGNIKNTKKFMIQ